MPPSSGRDLEQLVALLERHLSGSGVSVRSPDNIPDVVTGDPIKIDVSLRGRVGSIEVLVIMECRDRAEPGDRPWIEQLVGRRESVGAQRAVAVARSFSQPAVDAARRFHIDLRRIEDLDPSEVMGWFQLRVIHKVERRLVLHGATINIEPPPEVATSLPPVEQVIAEWRAAGALLWSIEGQSATVPAAVASEPRVFQGILPGAPPIRREVDLAYNPQSRFSLKCNGHLIPVTRIHADVELSLLLTEIPIAEVRQYAGEAGTLVQTVAFHLEHQGTVIALEAHRDVAKETTFITSRRIEGPPK
jgi:hypothetical protein